MLKVGLVGVGKMGLSHFAILKAHPDVGEVVICESSSYIRGALEKYTGVTGYDSFSKMLDADGLDAVVIATPSKWHARMVREALDRGVHVFCEKPFCLDPTDSKELATLATSKALVNQVGYHYRFLGTFNQARALIAAEAIGEITHVRVEAYGPVVLAQKGGTWRMNYDEGGGCLYDYACHAVDLVNYLVSPPTAISGAILNKIFSDNVDDEVYATLHFANGASGQIAANWSDESFRRMWTQASIWGRNGRIVVDRQELKIYIRNPDSVSSQLTKGWTVRNITELTPEVTFYLRGEEYSSQIDHFIQCIKDKATDNISSFASAEKTDEVVAMIRRAAEDSRLLTRPAVRATSRPRAKSPSLWSRVRAGVM